MRYVNVAALSAPSTATAIGNKIDSNQLISASFQFVFGDITAAGTMTIQMSNDECAYGNLPERFTPVNWDMIPSATSTVTAGVAAPIVINQLCARWIRVVFTETTPGTTTVICNMFALSV